MEQVVFESDLTSWNAWGVISNFLAKLNELTGKRIFTLEESVCSFVDGGLLLGDDLKRAKDFNQVDLSEYILEPQILAWVLQRIVGYGLLSYRLHEQVKVVSTETTDSTKLWIVIVVEDDGE